MGRSQLSREDEELARKIETDIDRGIKRHRIREKYGLTDTDIARYLKAKISEPVTDGILGDGLKHCQEMSLEGFKWFCRNVIKVKYKNVEGIAPDVRDEAGIDLNALMGPLVLNEQQERLVSYIISELKAGRCVDMVILKPRQVGFSTAIAALLIWLGTLYPGYGSTIFAQDAGAAAELYEETYQVMIDNGDPAFLDNPKKVEGGWKWPNSSRIYVKTAGTKLVAAKKGRGIANHGLHLSEVSQWTAAADTLLAANQTWVGKGPCVRIMECTANGMGGPGETFHAEYTRARDGKSRKTSWFVSCFDFTAYRLEPPKAWAEAMLALVDAIRERKPPPAGLMMQTQASEREMRWLTTGYQPTKTSELRLATLDQIWWRRQIITEACGGDESKADQEYPVTDDDAFLKSGSPVFTQQARETLIAMRERTVTPMQMRVAHNKAAQRYQLEPGTDGADTIYVYALPKRGHEYVIGNDTSDLRETYSTMVVLDRNTKEVVATWLARGHQHKATADLLYGVGKVYHTALLAPERASGGISVVDILFDVLRYPRIWITTASVKLRDGSESMNKPGWVTSEETKNLCCTTLAMGLIDGILKLNDKVLIEQLLGMERDEHGKFVRSRAAHRMTDLAMAALIAVRVDREMGPPTPCDTDEVDSDALTTPSQMREEEHIDRRDPEEVVATSEQWDAYRARIHRQTAPEPWEDPGNWGDTSIEDAPWD